MSIFYTYIIFSAKINKYYIGVTSDIDRRLKQHNSKASKFTKRASDWKIVHLERFDNLLLAVRRERYMKKQKSRKFIQDLTLDQKIL